MSKSKIKINGTEYDFTPATIQIAEVSVSDFVGAILDRDAARLAQIRGLEERNKSLESLLSQERQSVASLRAALRAAESRTETAQLEAQAAKLKTAEVRRALIADNNARIIAAVKACAESNE
jgi:small-conductance mechanosensitive channel